MFSQALRFFYQFTENFLQETLSYFSIRKNKSTENFRLIRYLRWFHILSLITLGLNTLNRE